MRIKNSFQIPSLLFFLVVIFYALACSADQNLAPTETQLSAPATLSYLDFALQEGDLLFADQDCGPFCDAIEKVTHGIRGADFSHVGMVVRDNRQRLVVIEAVTKGVIETPIDSFLSRSQDAKGQPKVLVGRLKTDFQPLIAAAVVSAQQRLGKAYDQVFDIANDKYYCSELIYYAFKEANHGTPIFQLRPMTYKDPDTKATFPVWQEYFEQLGQPIPEDQPGLNPGSMSRSIYLEVVHAYGVPTGYVADLPQRR